MLCGLGDGEQVTGRINSLVVIPTIFGHQNRVILLYQIPVFDFVSTWLAGHDHMSSMFSCGFVCSLIVASIGMIGILAVHCYSCVILTEIHMRHSQYSPAFVDQ